MKRINNKQQYNLRLNIIISLCAPSLALSSQAAFCNTMQNTDMIHRHSAIVGTPSKVGGELIKALSHLPKKIAYFNLTNTTTQQLSTSIINEIEKELAANSIIILDETQAHSADAVNHLTLKINGLKFSKPLLLITQKPDGSIHYRPASANDYSTKELIADLQAAKHLRKKRSSEPYTSGRTVYVTFSHNNLACPLASELKKVNYALGFASRLELVDIRDECAGRASYNAQVRLDYLPSRPTGTADPQNSTSLPPGKILRISIGPNENGGAGWHLADKQQTEVTTKKYSMWGSLTEVATRVGPAAESYAARITADNADDVRLIDHHPKNTNGATEVNEISTLTAEQGFNGNLSIGGAGPTLALSANTLSRDMKSVGIKYTINEYEVVNTTSGNRFNVTWQAAPPKMRSPSEIMGKQGGVDSSRFTPISYANFSPGYIATYVAPASKTGETTFNVLSQANVRAYYSYAAYDRSTATHLVDEKLLSLNDTITIDWESPYFLAEVPVVLKAYKHDALYCLTMKGENNEVAAAPCNQTNAQLWGFSEQQQYLSVQKPNLCLTARRQAGGLVDQLTTTKCEPSGFQEWEWAGENKDILVNKATNKRVSLTTTTTANGDNSIAVQGSINTTEPGGDTGNFSWKPYVQRPN